MIDWLVALFFAVPIYAYLGYPCLLWVAARWRAQETITEHFEPSVTLVIPAFNEARRITAKINNTLELEYPKSKLEVLVLSDGSTDQTAELSRMYATQGVKTLDLPHRGKMHALNIGSFLAKGEVVVFSDAAAHLNRDAIRLLVRHYSNPTVGGVCGAYRLSSQASTLDQLYWRYQSFLMNCESRIGTLSAANGPFYSVRRSLYPAPAASFINDDDVIPLILRAKGYQLLYEPQSVATESEARPKRFRRSVRTIAGTLQVCVLAASLLGSLRLGTVFSLISNRMLRLTVPLFMFAILIASYVLADRPFYAALFNLQLSFYGLAVLGAITELRSPIAQLPYYLCLRHAPILFAIVHAFLNFRKVKWR